MAKRRITMDLDEQLLAALDQAAAAGNRSRNQFLADAVRRAVAEMERQRIDAAFARMAEDSEYWAELQQVENELSAASDAAWRHLDRTEPRCGGGE